MTVGERVAAACERAVAYLLSRQCTRGGFCFYRTEGLDEPNLSDTYHALAALSRLGLQLPNRHRMRAFSGRFPRSRQPSDLFHLTAIARLLEPRYAPDADIRSRIDALRISPAPPGESTRLTPWLRRTSLVVRLKQDCGTAFDRGRAAARLRRLLHDGGFGPGPNLVDTRLAIEILRRCGAQLPPPGTLEFVDRLQVHGCGFTNTAASWTARLHVVAAGVACCRDLALSIRYPREALDFTLACQTAGGGFADAPDALADIALTHTAIETVLALESAPG